MDTTEFALTIWEPITWDFFPFPLDQTYCVLVYNPDSWLNIKEAIAIYDLMLLHKWQIDVTTRYPFIFVWDSEPIPVLNDLFWISWYITVNILVHTQNPFFPHWPIYVLFICNSMQFNAVQCVIDNLCHCRSYMYLCVCVHEINCKLLERTGDRCWFSLQKLYSKCIWALNHRRVWCGYHFTIHTEYRGRKCWFRLNG